MHSAQDAAHHTTKRGVQSPGYLGCVWWENTINPSMLPIVVYNLHTCNSDHETNEAGHPMAGAHYRGSFHAHTQAPIRPHNHQRQATPPQPSPLLSTLWMRWYVCIARQGSATNARLEHFLCSAANVAAVWLQSHARTPVGARTMHVQPDKSTLPERRRQQHTEAVAAVPPHPKECHALSLNKPHQPKHLALSTSYSSDLILAHQRPAANLQGFASTPASRSRLAHTHHS